MRSYGILNSVSKGLAVAVNVPIQYNVNRNGVSIGRDKTAERYPVLKNPSREGVDRVWRTDHPTIESGTNNKSAIRIRTN